MRSTKATYKVVFALCIFLVVATRKISNLLSISFFWSHIVILGTRCLGVFVASWELIKHRFFQHCLEDRYHNSCYSHSSYPCYYNIGWLWSHLAGLGGIVLSSQRWNKSSWGCFMSEVFLPSLMTSGVMPSFPWALEQAREFSGFDKLFFGTRKNFIMADEWYLIA